MSELILPDSAGNVTPFEDRRHKVAALLTRAQRAAIVEGIADALAKQNAELQEQLKAQSRGIAALAIKCGGKLIIPKEDLAAVRAEDQLAYHVDDGTGIGVFWVVTPEAVEQFQKGEAEKASTE